MTLSSTTTQPDCIIELYEQVRSIVGCIAREYGIELEDAMQEAYLIIRENWVNIYKAGKTGSMLTYARTVVRKELYTRLCRASPLSLDAPLTADSDETFAGTLFAPDIQIQPNENVTKVVHAALHQCTLEEQQYAREEFGLDTFKPMLSNWREKPTHGTPEQYLRNSIKCVLKLNPQIQSLLQRETCVL